MFYLAESNFGGGGNVSKGCKKDKRPRMTHYIFGDMAPVGWSSDDSDEDIFEEPRLIPAIHRYVFGNTNGRNYLLFLFPSTFLLVTHLRPCSLLCAHTDTAIRLDGLLLYTFPSLWCISVLSPFFTFPALIHAFLFFSRNACFSR